MWSGDAIGANEEDGRQHDDTIRGLERRNGCTRSRRSERARMEPSKDLEADVLERLVPWNGLRHEDRKERKQQERIEDLEQVSRIAHRANVIAPLVVLPALLATLLVVAVLSASKTSSDPSVHAPGDASVHHADPIARPQNAMYTMGVEPGASDVTPVVDMMAVGRLAHVVEQQGSVSSASLLDADASFRTEGTDVWVPGVVHEVRGTEPVSVEAHPSDPVEHRPPRKVLAAPMVQTDGLGSKVWEWFASRRDVDEGILSSVREFFSTDRPEAVELWSRLSREVGTASPSEDAPSRTSSWSEAGAHLSTTGGGTALPFPAPLGGASRSVGEALYRPQRVKGFLCSLVKLVDYSAGRSVC